MNEITQTIEIDSTLAVVDEPQQPSRNERGLTTVEYAIGIVLVITIVGVLATSADSEEFRGLVQNLFGVIFAKLTSGFSLPIPGLN